MGADQGSRRAADTRPLPVLRLLERTSAIPYESRLGRDLVSTAEAMQNRQSGHLPRPAASLQLVTPKQHLSTRAKLDCAIIRLWIAELDRQVKGASAAVCIRPTKARPIKQSVAPLRSLIPFGFIQAADLETRHLALRN
jgi:hypothetical protein